MIRIEGLEFSAVDGICRSGCRPGCGRPGYPADFPDDQVAGGASSRLKGGYRCGDDGDQLAGILRCFCFCRSRRCRRSGSGLGGRCGVLGPACRSFVVDTPWSAAYVSWVMQRAWKLSRQDIRKLPSVNDVPDMEALEDPRGRDED